jgi:hypothetical protein
VGAPDATPRVPRGGYLQSRTIVSACAALFTIGTITPAAPRSSAFLSVASSPSGTRTTQGSRDAASRRCVASGSSGACSMSTKSQSRPLAERISATSGAARVTTVPTRRSRARRRCEKRFASSIGLPVIAVRAPS